MPRTRSRTLVSQIGLGAEVAPLPAGAPQTLPVRLVFALSQPGNQQQPTTMASGSSDDDEDYDAFGETVYQEVRKYPIHDACEFDDVETLRVSAECRVRKI